MTTLRSLAQSSMLGAGPNSPPPATWAASPNSTPSATHASWAAGPNSTPSATHASWAALDPEAQLLASAALVGIAELGGRVLLACQPTLPACPDEARSCLPEPAAALLKRMLDGEFEAVLPEFLQLAAARRLLAPPELLPDLLAAPKTCPRRLLWEIAGERGRWLAAANPAWQAALELEGEDGWETGSLDQRVDLLQRLRLADSAAARRLVQSTWEQDPPQARAAFLAAFAAGLSMADEPFLEECLDNRRKEVRAAALDLLARLPASHLVQRMLARLEPVMRLKSKFLGGDVLEVSPINEDDAALRRDLSGEVFMIGSMGPQAVLLSRMISMTPPSVWVEKWHRSPEKLLNAALSSEWKEALITGWLASMRRTADPAWAAAAAFLILKHEDLSRIVRHTVGYAGVACLLPIEKLEALAQSSITPRFKELNDQHPLLDILVHYNQPWSEKLTRIVIDSIQRQGKAGTPRTIDALPTFARYIPPHLAEPLAKGWPQDPYYWQAPVFNQFDELLHFRSLIHI